MQHDMRRNDEITAARVVLVDADGTPIGPTSLDEARVIARGQDLDLVEVAPDADPPVCRLMDYARYARELEERRRRGQDPPGASGGTAGQGGEPDDGGSGDRSPSRPTGPAPSSADALDEREQ